MAVASEILKPATSGTATVPPRLSEIVTRVPRGNSAPVAWSAEATVPGGFEERT